MNLMVVPFIISGVRRRRFVHRENSQHRLNFCSDIRKAHWNSCLSASRGIQRGYCTLACSESQSRRSDSEWLRAALKDALLVAAPRAASKASLQAVWMALRRAGWKGESRAALRASRLHCYSSNCSHY
jgi:hypothetical protein